MKNTENNNDFYLVRVEETLARTFKVSKNKAKSLEDAEDIVTNLYQFGEINLEVDDFYDKTITAREVENEDLSLYDDIADYDSGYEYE